VSKKIGSKGSYLSKENLVSEVGARWWYVLPEWPPVGHNYSDDLFRNSLRLVDQARFQIEPEEDKEGLKKVYEVECYPGVFSDSKGILYDLRPYDCCPSLNNLMKKSVGELKDLAKEAIKKQLELCDESIKEGLRNKLKKLGG